MCVCTVKKMRTLRCLISSADTGKRATNSEYYWLLNLPHHRPPPLSRLFPDVLWLDSRYQAFFLRLTFRKSDVGFLQARHCIVEILAASQTERGWLGSGVVSMLDSGAEGPRFKSQSRRCRVTVLGKLFTPIVLLFTKQQNW